MRPFVFAAAALGLTFLAVPAGARAQTNAPPPGGSAFTPAPVPSVAPPTAQTGGQTSVPPERIAPTGTGTADQTDTSSPNTSPFSGPPSSLNPGTDQRSPGGGRIDPVTPNLSR